MLPDHSLTCELQQHHTLSQEAEKNGPQLRAEARTDLSTSLMSYEPT